MENIPTNDPFNCIVVTLVFMNKACLIALEVV